MLAILGIYELMILAAIPVGGILLATMVYLAYRFSTRTESPEKPRKG